ncbi:AraC family transcriptional regulator [Paenibacillus sp. SSG-1]|uniref:AraC family transcriptional regulator n=1 Tax=Paenibacillus sp. SSG-1 TaxID=1443669 RepID=UPI000B7CE595|nr:AraC family transcriptional regulator [Paenibacillus sp. SSG-1]OXL82064.1 AraC family transcriptional regulator [Paenibacillus sp. SSG-1]
MSFVAGNYSEVPLHFAYKRKSVNDEHKETFHSHLGVEILLIHQGKGAMIVNNNRYDIKPGMLCIFQPYQLHHLKLEYDEGQCFERSLVTFEPTMFESYFEKWPSLHTFYRFMYLGELPVPCLYDTGDELHILDAVYKSLDNQLPALSEAERYEEFSLFLVMLYRSIQHVWNQRTEAGLPKPALRQNHQVEHILTWIEANYTLPFRLDDMAKSLHLSPYHVSHLFKEATGISISEYIMARRVHQSVLLLTTTKKPISLIAEEIGLANSSYFCKLFKLRMGITPHQYRKKWARA